MLEYPTTQSQIFNQIVEKLATLSEAELKLFYVRLFKEELNNEWRLLSEQSNLSQVTEEEIDLAFLKSRYPHKYV